MMSRSGEPLGRHFELEQEEWNPRPSGANHIHPGLEYGSATFVGSTRALITRLIRVEELLSRVAESLERLVAMEEAKRR